jgi:general secretion pathway protein L
MRILGIDLGSTSVKAVELDSAFGRYEIREYYEQKVNPGEPPLTALRSLLESMPNKQNGRYPRYPKPRTLVALHSIIETLPKPPDRIAVAIRSGQITFRNIHLPTRDKKSIQAGITYELEDELPFPIDQAVYDYTAISQSGQSTQLHVSATLRHHLEASLEQWNLVNFDPDLVTTEAWAYRAFFNRLLNPAEQEKPVMLAQIGHQHATIYIHWRGAPIVSREVLWGGRDLTAAICRKYGIPLDEAESAKLDHGFVLPLSQRNEATSEQIDFSDTLQESLQELIRHIRQAELTCKNIAHEKVSKIYLAGGTALLPGLAPFMEEELRVSVKPLRSLSSIAPSGITYSEQTDAVQILAAASALCLVGPERSTAINLRKGNLAKQARTRELNLTNLKRPLAATLAVVISLIVSLVIQSNVYQFRLKQMDTDLEKDIRAFFGQIAGSAVRSYIANTSNLRSSINKELNKQRELVHLLGPDQKSPLNFLKELSAAIPKDVVVDLIEFQVGASPSSSYVSGGEQSASLSFLVSNPQIAEKLATLLNNKLSGIQRSKMEEIPVPDGTTKKWKVTFTGTPTEEAYGN